MPKTSTTALIPLAGRDLPAAVKRLSNLEELLTEIAHLTGGGSGRHSHAEIIEGSLFRSAPPYLPP
jgi:hypothetical protein